MSEKIVFIDDDNRLSLERHFAEVEGLGFEVIHARTAAQYEPILDGKKHQNAAMFVIDMRMPHGERWTLAQTRHQHHTGVWIVRDIRRCLPHVPIVLWTGLMDVDVKEAGKRQAVEKPRIVFIEKGLPKDFGGLVETYFSRGHFPFEWGRAWFALLRKLKIKLPGDIEIGL